MTKPSVAKLRQSISDRLERDVLHLIDYENLEEANWLVEKIEHNGVTRVKPDLHERLIRIIVDVWKIDAEKALLKRIVKRASEIKEDVEALHQTTRAGDDVQHLSEALDGFIAANIEPAHQDEEVRTRAAADVAELLCDISARITLAPTHLWVRLTTAVVGMATGELLAEKTIRVYCKKLLDRGRRFKKRGRPRTRPLSDQEVVFDPDPNYEAREQERDRQERIEAMRLWRPVREILDELLPEE
jgi:hypothetical protein